MQSENGIYVETYIWEYLEWLENWRKFTAIFLELYCRKKIPNVFNHCNPMGVTNSILQSWKLIQISLDISYFSNVFHIILHFVLLSQFTKLLFFDIFLNMNVCSECLRLERKLRMFERECSSGSWSWSRCASLIATFIFLPFQISYSHPTIFCLQILSKPLCHLHIYLLGSDHILSLAILSKSWILADVDNLGLLFLGGYSLL